MKNNPQLTDRVAIITGASSGIGAAIARRFAAAGATVVIVGRNRQALSKLEEEIKELGARQQKIVADLSDETAAAKIVQETIDRFGHLDILVNAAGVIATGNIENTSLASWDSMMNLNLRSIFQLMQFSVPYLKERKGNIVNISSVAGTRSFPNVLAYCVSKAALDQLTRCAALELAESGVRVNAINPGVVVTEIHRRGGMDEDAYQAFLERSKSTHPMGRVGRPEEIAELALFIASDLAGWITGATHAIDGGRALTCAR